jgi:LSD1 subclass zinc finger protein
MKSKSFNIGLSLLMISGLIMLSLLEHCAKYGTTDCSTHRRFLSYQVGSKQIRNEW